MKVWVCSDGEYSAYGVTAIYSREEDAKAISKAYGWNDPDEFELDPAIPDEVRKGLVYFRVVLTVRSTLMRASEKPWVTAARPDQFCKDESSFLDGGRFSTYCWAADEDAAVKIAAEQLGAGADRRARAMTVDQLIVEVRKVLAGIDGQETDEPPGWWETSTGAEFGRQKLAEIEALLRRACLTDEEREYVVEQLEQSFSVDVSLAPNIGEVVPHHAVMAKLRGAKR